MNSLKALGKEYDEEEKVRKIIKSLPADWKAKKGSIEEANDLDSLKVDELLGSLRLYELELEEEDPKTKKQNDWAQRTLKYFLFNLPKKIKIEFHNMKKCRTQNTTMML